MIRITALLLVVITIVCVNGIMTTERKTRSDFTIKHQTNLAAYTDMVRFIERCKNGDSAQEWCLAAVEAVERTMAYKELAHQFAPVADPEDIRLGLTEEEIMEGSGQEQYKMAIEALKRMGESTGDHDADLKRIHSRGIYHAAPGYIKDAYNENMMKMAREAIESSKNA